MTLIGRCSTLPSVEVPPREDGEFWEPRALKLLDLLEKRGPMSLRAIKAAMTREKFKVALTVNLLSYLALTGRASFSRKTKEWRARKS